MTEHIGELKLRRLFAGELDGSADAAHLAACEACKAKLKQIEGEQRRFEAEIPFERFEAGVRRAQRNPRVFAPPPSRVRWLTPVMGMAAAAMLVFVVGAQDPELTNGMNHRKGADEAYFRVGTNDGAPQRFAALVEPLSHGERVRVGYKVEAHRFVTTVSIDDQGVVTPLYPEVGQSLLAMRDAQDHYLPDSVEFTGKGPETVIVVLSDEALDVGKVIEAARQAFDSAGRDVTKIGRIDVPGEQFKRTFLKP